MSGNGKTKKGFNWDRLMTWIGYSLLLGILPILLSYILKIFSEDTDSITFLGSAELYFFVVLICSSCLADLDSANQGGSKGLKRLFWMLALVTSVFAALLYGCVMHGVAAKVEHSILDQNLVGFSTPFALGAILFCLLVQGYLSAIPLKRV